MSFWMVPESCAGLTPCSSAAAMYERHHRQHGAVHGHADAHLVERDAVEERARVVDRVDRDAGHAHVAAHPWVVGVVAAVRGQVEGDAEALLARREVAAVEGVGGLGGGEAGVLPDRPGLGRVHRRVGPAQERAQARARCPARRGGRGARARSAARCRCPRGSATASVVSTVRSRRSRSTTERIHARPPGVSKPSSLKLFGTVMPAPPGCGAGTQARRHPSRSCRRRSRPACRR